MCTCKRWVYTLLDVPSHKEFYVSQELNPSWVRDHRNVVTLSTKLVKGEDALSFSLQLRNVTGVCIVYRGYCLSIELWLGCINSFDY